MRRFQLATALLYVLAIALTTGCVSISKNVQVGVRSYRGETLISIAIPTRELSFNLHAAGWTNGLDRFEITIPRGKDHASGSDVRLAVGIAGTDFVEVDAARSSVTLVGSETCKISIAIFNSAGVPYKVNGTYESDGPFCHR